MGLVAVIDSSPLINLVYLQLESIHVYFDTVYVPRMVQREVNRKSKFRHRLNKLYARGVFRRCAVVDQVSVRLLEPVDAGEAEALVQGSEKGVSVFIGDEREARRMSERRGMRPVGTARLLARMNLEGYAADPASLISKLKRDLKCRIADKVLHDAMNAAANPF